MSTPNDGSQAAKPKTVGELVAMNTFFRTHELEDQSCMICNEKYVSGPSPEFAMKLPACGHTLGVECVKTWLSEKKNTCPVCRARILDIEEPRIKNDENSTAYEVSRPEDFNETIDGAANTLCDSTEAYLGAEVRLRNLVADPARAFRPGLYHLVGSYVRRYGSSLGQYRESNTPECDQIIARGAINGGRYLRSNRDNLDATLEALNLLHGMTHLFELNHDRLHAAAADSDRPVQTLTSIMLFTDDYLAWEERFQDAMVRARGSIDRGNRNEVLNNLYDLVDTHMHTDARLREAIVDHRYHRRSGDLPFHGES